MEVDFWIIQESSTVSLSTMFNDRGEMRVAIFTSTSAASTIPSNETDFSDFNNVNKIWVPSNL